MTFFTHYVYDSQGPCLKGLVLAEDATAEEVVRAYLDATDGILIVPPFLLEERKRPV